MVSKLDLLHFQKYPGSGPFKNTATLSGIQIFDSSYYDAILFLGESAAKAHII